MANTINTGIPSSLLVPGFYFSISPANAGNQSAINRVLIVGQITPGDTGSLAAAGVPVAAGDVATIKSQYGRGSVLSIMYEKYRATEASVEAWLLPITAPVGAVAATSDITIVGPAAANGTLALYVCGKAVSVPVAAGATGLAIAAAAANLIEQALDLPVTASGATASDDGTGAVFTLTAKNAGLAAGDIDVRLNHAGAIAGEYTPAGVSVTVTHTAGSGDPDMALALSTLGDKAFDAVILPFASTNAVAALNAVLNEQGGRWSYAQQLFGFGFSAAKGSVASLVSLGDTMNSKYFSMLGVNTPEPVYAAAAAYGATCVASLAVDPGLPLQNVAIDLVAPSITEAPGFASRNTLLGNGVSTMRVNDGGQVVLERAVTTSRNDEMGLPTAAWRDVETLFCLALVVKTFRADMATKFARVKLVDDNARIAFGSSFVTPRTVLAEAIAVYQGLAADGIVSDAATFASKARTENAGGGRVNLFLPIVLANQLRQIAIRFSFDKA